jgi:hypothetical protein
MLVMGFVDISKHDSSRQHLRFAERAKRVFPTTLEHAISDLVQDFLGYLVSLERKVQSDGDIATFFCFFEISYLIMTFSGESPELRLRAQKRCGFAYKLTRLLYAGRRGIDRNVQDQDAPAFAGVSMTVNYNTVPFVVWFEVRSLASRLHEGARHGSAGRVGSWQRLSVATEVVTAVENRALTQHRILLAVTDPSEASEIRTAG